MKKVFDTIGEANKHYETVNKRFTVTYAGPGVDPEDQGKFVVIWHKPRQKFFAESGARKFAETQRGLGFPNVSVEAPTKTRRKWQVTWCKKQ